MSALSDDPFAGFTPAANEAVAFAGIESRAFGQARIAPEHLLLGLARVRTGLAARALAAVGADHSMLRSTIAEFCGVRPDGGEGATAEDVPLGLGTQRVVTAARREAVRRDHGYIGTEHLLLAIAAAPGGLAAGVLEHLGVDLARIMDAVEALLGSESAPATPAVVVGVSDATETPAALGFDDVAGCDAAKAELAETVAFLVDPARFVRLGARLPRGIILHGPPGTGKTLLARAMAGEAGVPFFPVAGSDFVEIYVGTGAKRIRDLFRKARKAGRAIIFIDEIDALARARDRSGGGGNAEADQTLNALLVEMDGVGTGNEVVVVAATNRIELLDPAVLRPGRFTRHVEVPIPDLAGRIAILRLHARGKPLAADADLPGLARRSAGFGGAELANILNEAALIAARRDGDAIGAEDLHAGWLRTKLGTTERRVQGPKERALAAAHEVGHALCSRFGGAPMSVEEISLHGHGSALAVTVYSEHDGRLQTLDEHEGQLVALMGGRAGEWLAFGEITTGITSDLEKANRLVEGIVRATTLGRGTDALDTDGIVRGDPLGLLSGTAITGSAAEAALEAQRRMLEHGYLRALGILRERRDLFERICAHAFEQERVGGETLEALVAGRIVPSEAALHAWHDAVASVRSRRQSGDVAPEGAPASDRPVIDTLR